MRLSKADDVVVLTGAGISRESGLHTFRDADGIWAKHSIEDVATPGAWRRDPGRVREFYNARRRDLLSPAVKPNAAHAALAKLEREHAGSLLVVTQNVDDLHERAGTKSLIHMHGELLKSRCSETGRIHEQRGDITEADPCSCCRLTGTLRPHVVWFGEVPLELDRVYPALRSCALFAAIGTSGEVWPAAGFVDEVRRSGRARTVELTLEATGLTPIFDEAVHGPATTLVPAFVERLLASDRGE